LHCVEERGAQAAIIAGGADDAALLGRALVKSRKLVSFAVALIGLLSALRPASGEVPLQTVPKVDLDRYTGRWFEIARYPNFFERKCDSNAMASYALRPDGKISVINTCKTREGALKQANGWAEVVDQKSGSKLKVTFFWPFFGDYWIIDLGPNYEYAVVGEPSRKYLWILSRTAKMDDRIYAEITSRLAAKGYDAGKLERGRQ
jgi:apolipoprotein D and lipocalin family protein